MKYPLTLLLSLLLCCATWAYELGGSSQFAVRFDEQSGILSAIIYNGETVTLPNPPTHFFDIRQDNDWIFGKSKLELVNIRKESNTVVNVTHRLGDWTITFRYTVNGTTLCWNAELTYNGKEPTKIRGFWRSFPIFPFEQDAEFFVPGQYPPIKHNPSNFAEGTRQGLWRNSAPLVFQLDKSKSVILLSDQLVDYGDRPSGDVSRRDGGVRLVQSFDTQGHIKPGVKQYVGDGYLKMVDGDAEAALLNIHDLMRDIGHVVPKDRPEWFESAIMYSFHPGGTIGSNFRDLGGFTAAMPLLDRIKELGCNSIWIMPIEDRSVYWPRDYYKFQEGLGTSEEYKALVARAHELGLHVLQDSVPHGGSNTYQRMIDNPQWLAQEEDGSTLYYWCADFNYPTWIEYMSDVARHYVREYGVDGYRVDACGGSKIPNWNPEIPYARASHSQSQGGLNMLRGIRNAVKELKPVEGAILAEVNGSLYGAVSDAVYDFDMCYNILHDVRKQPAEEFVKRLRRWLHEQQYGEIPGLLRLRHVESHDSLRGQLWYGTEPHRALVALTTFIHGIPLVYHEQEEGNFYHFRRLFALRNALPELQGGDTDYLCVDAPPGLFAVLRKKEDNVSVVTINFNDKPIEGVLKIPLDKLTAALKTNDAWVSYEPVFEYSSQENITNLLSAMEIADGYVQIPCTSLSFGETSFVLFRKNKEEMDEVRRNLSDASVLYVARNLPVKPAESGKPDAESIVWQLGNDYTVYIDPESGLLTQYNYGDVILVGKADMLLPTAYLEQAEKPSIVQKDEEITVTRKFGNAVLQISYARDGVFAFDDGTFAPYFGMATRWTGTDIPANAALSFSSPENLYWFFVASEGVLGGHYHPKHLMTDGVLGSIYWRPQGTNLIFDSLLHPLGIDNGAGISEHPVVFTDNIPARVRILDRLGDKEELSLAVSWTDESAPLLMSEPALTFYFGAPPIDKRETPNPLFRPAPGGWIYENEHYRLRIARNGTITSLDKHLAGTPVLAGCDLYTDYGYGGEGIRYGASNDVEAACRIVQDGDTLRLRFEGQLRGFGRFELLRPPVEYFVEYALDDSPGFALSYGVKTSRQPPEGRAFLGAMFPLPEVETFEYFKEGEIITSGSNVGNTGRTPEYRLNDVDTVVLRAADKSLLLHLSDIEGDAKLFLNRQNFFITFDDGGEVGPPNRWRTVSATVAVDGSPARAASAVQRNLRVSAQDEAANLVDGGFEHSSDSDLVSLRTSAVFKGAPQQQGGWQTPRGGSIDITEKRSGKSSARVVGEKGDYRLFTQDMDTKAFPAGTKLKLTAWVKGENIERGDVSWQVGCIRFGALVDGNMQYISVPELLGTFDWKQSSVEYVVPENLQGLNVQVGLNGAAGTLWIDDATVEAVR